ncbi:MAG: hypothetical protein K0Q50_1439 [Vampirovibrio sp.]|nr:hypothetical protein [Vampirovibrio sp.]
MELMEAQYVSQLFLFLLLMGFSGAVFAIYLLVKEKVERRLGRV